MANLPPRPGSPLRLPPRDDRRHIVDERERDRDRRSAQPMAPRYRSGRSPERDRAYIPRPRLDTYVAPPYEGRRMTVATMTTVTETGIVEISIETETETEIEGIGTEREIVIVIEVHQEGGHQTETVVHMTETEGLQDDHLHLHDVPVFDGIRALLLLRDEDILALLPIVEEIEHGVVHAGHKARKPFHCSQSPFALFTLSTSPLSPSRRPNRRTQSPPRDEQKPLPTEPSADRRKEEPMNTTLDGLPTNPVKIEEPSSLSVPPLPQTPILDQTKQIPAGQDSTQGLEEIKSESKPESLPVIPPALPKPEPEQPIAPPTITALPEAADVKMDVDSPKPPTLTSTHSRGSTPPKPSPMQVIKIAGLRPDHAGDQHALLPGGLVATFILVHHRRRNRHLPTNLHHGVLEEITDLHIKPPLQNLDLLCLLFRHIEGRPQVTWKRRLQTQKANLGLEHYQHINSARRALQELDMASIDMQAAENRRRIADLQLEKAKTGSLGIDAPLTDFGGI
ncbi:hypothetical protein BJ912DRAFT_1038258 [Pholiota molesta]|nr:hypothetical protein BJ912DRAFT_1038258 [Pholiota molesta]